MTDVLLVGADVALLEGLAQSLGGQGYRPVVTSSLADARDVASSKPPLVIVVDRSFASSSGADLLGIPVAAGGARLLYRGSNTPPAPLLPALQRSVLADLTLPLERHRLVALVQSITARARATGRRQSNTPTENRAQG